MEVLSAPMSFAQQRLWFLDKLEPGGNQYTICYVVRLVGELDVAALRYAFEALVGRHESLRTIFDEREGEPVQVVLSGAPFELKVTDLRGRPDGVEVAQERIEELRLEPFNLGTGPLFRAELIRESAVEQVLLLAMHHIISDGWSMGVLKRELSALYNAYVAGEDSPLEELPIQYADYAVWQREWLQGEELEAQLGYWREQLSEVPRLELPLDRPWPAAPTFAAGHHRFELDASLTRGLRELSRARGVTLFTTLLAAFVVLLHRYSGQDDIAVGIPIAGRNRQDIEGLIGFFVNTLVIRSRVNPHSTFNELLAETAATTLRSLDHMDLPFERLVEELNPERTLNRTPIFDVMFNMFADRTQPLELTGMGAKDHASPPRTAKFPLELYVMDLSDNVALTLVYQAELFDAARAGCCVDQYVHLLRQLVAAPNTSVEAFSLVDPGSRARLPDPRAPLDAPSPPPVAEMVGKWLARAPARTAVSAGTREWTCAELREACDRIARTLLDITPAGAAVGILGRTSFGFVAALLGVLRSGRVVLTLDADLPAGRLARLVQAAGASLILEIDGEQSAVAAELAGMGVAATSLAVDPATGRLSRAEPVGAPDRVWPTLSGDDPAYIFFTSGSSGTPKAVVGRQKSLTHFLAWQRETFEIGAQDRVAQLTLPSFDVILRDVLLPISSGGVCCLPSESDRADVLAWLDRERVTVLHTVPALLSSWLAAGSTPRLGNLRWIFCSGEPLMDALVRRWRAACPDAGEMVNLYGPTETTMVRTYFRLPATLNAGVQPVGVALPDTQALVLNASGGLCGVSERGEIALRTPFSTLGYLNAPDEQTARFRNNPFTGRADDTIYFTGDAGRYRPDGILEILGRLDDEVKIHGVRVDPNEIDAIVCEHPAVQASVTVAHKESVDGTRLVAYVMPTDSRVFAEAEVMQFLRERLPRIMVPSRCVAMTKFPLLPTGKVDRARLPDPPPQAASGAGPRTAPRTPEEQSVCDIWAAMLGCERVGIHDDFFALGGHSLMAVQIISRIRTTLGVEVPLRVLFEQATVAGLAEYLSNHPSPAKPREDAPIQPTNRADYRFKPSRG